MDDDESSHRYAHACVAGIGGQVIVSGGLNTLQSDRWIQTDVWPNALNVFDMSALAWSEGYKVNKEYETPQMVRAWYDDGYVLVMMFDNGGRLQTPTTQADLGNSRLRNVTWSSDHVRDLFGNNNGRRCHPSSSSPRTTWLT